MTQLQRLLAAHLFDFKAEDTQRGPLLVDGLLVALRAVQRDIASTQFTHGIHLFIGLLHDAHPAAQHHALIKGGVALGTNPVLCDDTKSGAVVLTEQIQLIAGLGAVKIELAVGVDIT